MKQLATVFIGIFLLAACGRESSPDGRSQIRDEKLQSEIDSLKGQGNILRDSINSINRGCKINCVKE
jgi:hypothetical protein